MPPVSNRFPTLPNSKRIAIVGEFPGKDEVSLHQPFVGMAGRFLSALLSRAGIPREAAFLGSVCQYQPPTNDISRFHWNGDEIQEGLFQLCEDLEKFRPNVVVLLGSLPLKAAKDAKSIHPLLAAKYRFKTSAWRGSLFLSDDGPFKGMKCLPSFSPAYVLRDYEQAPLLQFDLKKAVREADRPTLLLPKRSLLDEPTFDDIMFRLANIRELRQLVALDIEGYVNAMSCISFATAPDHAFIVPFFRKDKSRCWTPEQECRIWRALAETLEDDKVPKVLQNSLYDRFVLHYSYGIRVRGVVEDTMLKHWSNYAELPKALGVQTSLYTNEPYYKGDGKSDNDKTFYRYCCLDSAVTHEICAELDKHVVGKPLEHYKLNVALLNPLLYIEMRGIKYNIIGAAQRRDAIRLKLFETQAKLNALVGCAFKSKNDIFAKAREVMAFKKATIATFTDIARNARKDYIASAERLAEIVRLPPSLSILGEIEDLCEQSLNVSSAEFKTYLYDVLKLPIQYKKLPNGADEPTITTDYEALIKLCKEIKDLPNNEHSLAVLRCAIDIRAMATRQRMLSISADEDGRIRCGYNIVGTDTGRVSCYTSPTGSGYNLQTIPKYEHEKDAPGGILGDRDLFIADDDHWFFQCDLAGADGWTVAAWCKFLGDSTMLDDYLYGLKPAKILALMVRGVQVDYTDRAALKEASKKVSSSDWDYYAMKRVQHGSAYLEGGITISRSIFKDSEGKFYMPPAECKKLKELFFFKRYPGVPLWQNKMASLIKQRPVITAASGQSRQFFGRPDEILTKVVAHEPQANTTYATNLAMYRLWTDPDNRMQMPNMREGNERPMLSSNERGMGISTKLRIEPLHQVHDALCGQFKKTNTEWAIKKIRSYFDNPITIAGQQIVIPFEGGYGESWGNLKEGNL